MKTLNLLFLILLVSVYSFGQRATKIGLTGTASRFYPVAKPMGLSRNNSMDNGFSWSGGFYVQQKWIEKMDQIIEMSFQSSTSDVFFEKTTNSPGGYSSSENRYFYFNNYHYNNFLISAGIKYYLSHNVFLYPAFELSRSLNRQVDINKTTYNVRGGLGMSFSHFDVALDYSYGLRLQRTVFDTYAPFLTTHRNKYFAVKVQIPVFNSQK